METKVEYCHRFAPPVKPIAPKQLLLRSGTNVVWTNINTGEVVYILSVGENCFIAEDAIIGKNVILMNLITITGNCIIGGQNEKTIIHNGFTIYANSDISGEITQNVAANSVIHDGMYIINGINLVKKPRARNYGRCKHIRFEDPHYRSDNFD